MASNDPKRQVNIYLTEEEMAALREAAEETGLSENEIAKSSVRLLIAYYKSNKSLHLPPQVVTFAVEELEEKKGPKGAAKLKVPLFERMITRFSAKAS
jgi:8-oxo-dGTP pyrophosphatase MutT (NUDIX family)